MVVRDFAPADLPRIKEIHGQTSIDYKFPDITSPLFLVTKVVEFNGIVRQCGGLYLQVECYLWSDPSEWADPATKFEGIKELDRQSMQEVWLKGIECACLWLPPGMGRFGERLVEDLGFSKDRDGWVSYSKKLGPQCLT